MSIIPEIAFGLWNAWIFMIWPLVLSIIPKFIITDKKVNKTIQTSAPMKGEKILNVLSMAAVIGGFIYSLFLPLPLYTLWFYVGLVVFICGLMIHIAVFFTLRKARPDKPFVTGPYRYSRHPIYLALFLIIISVFIMSFSWIFLIIILIIIIHLLLAAPAEERYCLKKYGKEYQEYLDRTPRLIGLPKSHK